MEGLTAAYLIAWAATTAYLIWLSVHHAYLMKRKHALSRGLSEPEKEDASCSKPVCAKAALSRMA